MTSRTIAAAAELLDTAVLQGQLVDLLTVDDPALEMTIGYEIQDALMARHVARGARISGAKLGLTSRAKQQEMHVHEPIGGWLTDRMALAPGEPLDTASLVQPRCEPEIAFRLARDLAGADTTADDVMAATSALMTAIEVLDSRYRDYRFTLADVIADDASAARYLLGEPVDPATVDRVGCGVRFFLDDAEVAQATGAAVMGDPAAAVAWWVRHLASTGRGLDAGMIVLSGALTGAHRVRAGSRVRAQIEGLGSLELACR